MDNAVEGKPYNFVKINLFNLIHILRRKNTG